MLMNTGTVEEMYVRFSAGEGGPRGPRNRSVCICVYLCVYLCVSVGVSVRASVCVSVGVSVGAFVCACAFVCLKVVKNRVYSLRAYVSIRRHTSAYVGIRRHTSAYVSIRSTSSKGVYCLNFLESTTTIS
jgi:hypothetical protein